VQFLDVPFAMRLLSTAFSVLILTHLIFLQWANAYLLARFLTVKSARQALLCVSVAKMASLCTLGTMSA
jgi:hypothetical protein